MTDDVRLDWLRRMIEIRRFEEKIQELFMTGEVQGTTHLCQGQEGVAVGAVAAMGASDVFTNTYRGHGQALARGMAPETAFAELMGRRSGGSHGVGGSMHLVDAAAGNLGSNAIVAAGLPIAVGAAMAFRLRREPRVALTFCGDGATNIGTFHEALNLAAVWVAPVVFIVENNLYGEYSPVRDTTPIDDLVRRADAYAMPGLTVDGQDVVAVNAVVGGAVERARNGGGPTLIEAKTYRYRGHSRSDPGKYRPAGELDTWKARDPIEILASLLTQEGVLDGAGRAVLERSIQGEIDAAAARAASAPYPELEEARAYVYAG